MIDDEDRGNMEEHQLPGTDAMLAATLALMTGYSQALQADTHPLQRLAMGEKIVVNLLMLSDRPGVSPGFCEVLRTLQRCWLAMSACTRDAAGQCDPEVNQDDHPKSSAHSLAAGNWTADKRLH